MVLDTEQGSGMYRLVLPLILAEISTGPRLVRRGWSVLKMAGIAPHNGPRSLFHVRSSDEKFLYTALIATRLI